MGLDAGVAPYNIDMPAVTHIANVRRIVREKIFESDPLKDARYKSTITALLLRGDGFVVGLKKGYPWNFDYVGKRFSNEAPALFALDGLDFQNWMTGGSFAAILSNDDIESMKTAGIKFPQDTIFWMVQGQLPSANAPIADIDEIIAKGVEKGNVIQAPTLEKLVEELAKDYPDMQGKAQTLRDEITRYNGFVTAAQAASNPAGNFTYDSPGSGGYGKDAQKLVTKVTLDNSTGYTAILGAGYFYCTVGGLDVNENAQALDVNHNPIPGLYAVGNDSGGVLYNQKKAYVGYGAAAQGWAVTSGRFAGAHAADYALNH
jgi:hypothetical protein